MITVRALTIKNPWAHVIAHHGKDVENRDWPIPSTVSAPFTLLVHAGLAFDYGATDFLRERIPSWSFRRRFAYGPRNIGSVFVRGGVFVAVATVTGCHETSLDGLGLPDCCTSPWAMWEADWHWQLTGIQPLPEPVPARGSQRLWIPTPEQAEACISQLESTP